MAGIQMSGLASGLDTQSIISQLMAVEELPRTIITNKQAAAQARQTALQDIQTKLSSLKLATTALSSVTTWGNSQTVDSSDATKATVRTVAGAPPGGHQLVVTQLARGAQATYAYSPPATAGSVTVNGLAVDVPVGATLDQAVVAINEASYPDGQGVFAVNVNGQLAISSRTTGSASQAVVTGLGTLVGSGVAGADATGSVDGVAFTSSSNVVTDALPGVEMTLKAATDSTGISINVGNPGPSADAVVNAAKAFVSAYNSVVDAVRSRTTEARVPNPANAAHTLRPRHLDGLGERHDQQRQRRRQAHPRRGQAAIGAVDRSDRGQARAERDREQPERLRPGLQRGAVALLAGRRRDLRAPRRRGERAQRPR
jgi:flagellar hook-associated protein 2